MPTISDNYHDNLIETMKNLSTNNRWYASTINLGGVPGSGGGSGIPLGGFIGQLIQSQVAYDTTEAALQGGPVGSGWSLVDNLNHIRYSIANMSGGVGGGSGVTTPLVIRDEGIQVASGIYVINFTGPSVTATLSSGVVNITISGTGGGAGSGIVMVSEDDAVPNYLESKLAAGTKITVATINPGGNEQSQISFAGMALNELSDTAVTTPASGQALVWNSLKWVASGITTGGTGGGSGIPYISVYDSGSFVGNVTEIDFGTNLTATLNGVRATVAGAAAGSGTGASRWIGGIYVGTFFDETDETLQIVYSYDSKTYGFVNQSYSDTVRDPSILFWDNLWWIAHTHNGSPTDYIPIISSPDLINWTTVVELDTSTMGAASPHSWAPEWFVDSDDSVHLFMATGDTGAHKIYETHPTNDAWTTWANLTEVTGTSFPSDMIDPSVYKIDTTYNLFYKDDGTNYTCLATSNFLTSGYIVAETGDWAGFGTDSEGFSIVQLRNNSWRAFWNDTLTNGIFTSVSEDNFATWSAPAVLSGLQNSSHGTVIQVSDLAGFSDLLPILNLSAVAGVSGVAVGAEVTRSSSLSINNATPTAITWNTEVYDTGGFWDVSDPTKFTITQSGWYAMSAYAWWAADSDGGRRLYWLKDGTTTLNRESTASPAQHNDVSNSTSAVAYLTSGQYLQVIADQNSNNALNITACRAGIVAIGGGAGGTADTYKSKVTTTDTTEDYLQNKIRPGANVTITLVSGGANEFLQIASIASGTAGSSSPIVILDEGIQVASGVSILNFVGSGVTASLVGGIVTVTVTTTSTESGGSGITVIWEDVTSQIPASGDNYTISQVATSGSIQVFLNGLLQLPTNITQTTSGFHTSFSPISGDELVATYLASGVTGSSNLEVKASGVAIASQASSLNFTGGLAAVAVGNNVTITSANPPRTIIGARVYSSSGIQIPTGVDYMIGFDAERWDTDSMWSSSDKGKLIISTSGYYLVEASIKFAANSTGNRGLKIRKNSGNTAIAGQFSPTAAGNSHFMSVSTLYNFSPGDYVTISLYQNSGSNLECLREDAASPEFSIQRIS